MVLAQSVTIVLALASIHGAVRTDSARRLTAARAMLDRTLAERSRRLRSATDVLVRDFGFKEAVATADLPTMQSALSNHAARVDAELAVLYGLDGTILTASTSMLAEQARRGLHLPEANSAPLPFALVGGRPYQIVFAPLRAPQTIGWVALGFALDRSLAKQLAELSSTDVSFVFSEPNTANNTISSLTTTRADSLALTPPAANSTDEPSMFLLDGEQYLTLSSSLQTQNGTLRLVAQQSQDIAMAQFHQIRLALLVIGSLALLSAIAVALWVSRSAARPLGILVKAAKQIERGYYCDNIQVAGSSEFQRLADTFNSMQLGIRERETHILHQATHDALTGLSNREGLRQCLVDMPKNKACSILMLDVQRFRDINASVGHQVGDQLLIALSERIAQLAAATTLCARVGADQFVAICAQHDSELLHRALILSDEMREGVQVGEIRLSVDVHIGISEWSEPRILPDDFLRQADVALLQAKERGTVAVVYQPSHDREHRRRVTIVSELRKALVGDGLTLHYQPLINMTDGAVVGFEALLRWSHPTLGNISPAEFVPLAERASVLPDLSKFVLDTAIGQLGRWHREGIEAEIAVNLSAADFADGELSVRVLDLLCKHQAPATRLLLEVTESAIMREPQLAAQVMQQLRTSGVRFAIDDFGTGHSSLAQLHALPVDELKIDRAFVMNLDRSASNNMIVRTTIDLGHSLGLKVVAEGIETSEAWATLLRLGCDLAQGYFISRPMAAQAVPGWIHMQRQQIAQALEAAEQSGAVATLRGRARH